MPRSAVVLPLAAVLAAAPAASAHDLWLVPPAAAAVGTRATVRAVSGTAFPTGDHAPDPAKFARRVVVGPDGTAGPLDAAGTAGGDGVLRFDPAGRAFN